MEPVGPEVQRQQGELLRRRQGIHEILAEWSCAREWSPDCEQCKPLRGLISVERAGERLAVPCPLRQQLDRCRLARLDKQQRQRAARRWLQEAGVPRRYWGMSIEHVAAPVREDIRAYLERLEEHIQRGQGLLIAGDVGVGKSAIMGLVSERACDLSISSVRWAHATDLFTALCERGSEESRHLWDWRSCRLLLLDDFAAAYMHAFPVGRFEAFMEARHGDMLATCVTTNLLGRGLEETREIARLVDRWSETCYVLQIRGPSRRQPLEGLP